MLEEIVADIVCSPTVANFTENVPVPERLPKLTKKVLGEKVAFGSVALKITVYEPSVKPQLTRMAPVKVAPILTVLGETSDEATMVGQARLLGST